MSTVEDNNEPVASGSHAASDHHESLGNTLLDKCNVSNTAKTWIRKFVAEFTGLVFFTFIAGASANSFNNLEEATAQGLTIALLIIGFGHISGGHFNPAVTLGVLCCGGISIFGAVIYWVAQILGSILGGFFVWCVMKDNLYMAINGGATPVNWDVATPFEAYLMETFITSILVYTVLMCALHQESQPLTGLAIGFAVFVGVITGGPVSDGSMNPARSLGPLVTYSGAHTTKYYRYTLCENFASTRCLTPATLWGAYWVDFAGPLSGALLAALFYRLFYSDVPSLYSRFEKSGGAGKKRSLIGGRDSPAKEGYGAL